MQSRANNESRISVKRLYNADHAHRLIDDNGEDKKAQAMVRLAQAVKGFDAAFRSRGG